MKLTKRAIYTDGPSYSPNDKYIVTVIAEQPGPLKGFYLCENPETKERIVCHVNQLEFLGPEPEVNE